MGFLSVVGGLGAGITQSVKNARQDDLEQQQQAENDYKLQQMADDAQQRSQVADAVTGAQDAAQALKANSVKTQTGIRAGKAAALKDQSQTASAADSFARAPGSDTPLDPTTTGIMGKTDMLGGKGPVDLSASPGIRPLPASGASAADSGDPAMDDATAFNLAWKAQAPKVAQIYMQHGHPQMAAEVMKTANDAEMNAYETKYRAYLRTSSSGDDQSTAKSIQDLYNLDFPDGHGVDIKPLGEGKFQVVHYDQKTGKAVQGGVVDRDQLDNYAQTFLNPAERVKLQIADKVAKRQENTANIRERGIQAQADQRERTAAARDEANFQRTLLLTTSQQHIQAAHDASREAAADKRAAGKPDPDAKAEDAQVKSAMQQVRAIASSKGVTDPGMLTKLSAAAENSIRNGGMDAAAATKDAFDQYEANQESAKAGANAHMADLHSKDPFLGRFTTTIQQQGDPDAVKAATNMPGGLNESNYKKAVSAKLLKGGTIGSTSPAVKGPQGAAPVTKTIGGVTYVQRNGQWYSQ